MSILESHSSPAASQIAAARQVEFVGFLHRLPFALDAFRLGYLPGFREDCGYQADQYQDLTLSVRMLDNDFRNPDLERFVDRFFEYEPQVGVIGDVYDHAGRLVHEFSDPADWRGRRVHILGGSPPKQLDAIRQLTQPTLTDEPPANIAGVDWNGLHRGAQFGEFWTADGWDDSGRDADHVTVRKTVRHSLARIREFWDAHGIWPESTPQDEGMDLEYEGPKPADLEQAACAECGTNVWRTRRVPYVAEYDTGTICGYCSYECYFSHRHRNNLEEIDGEQSVYLPPA